jgi:hypothetical protein
MVEARHKLQQPRGTILDIVAIDRVVALHRPLITGRMRRTEKFGWIAGCRHSFGSVRVNLNEVSGESFSANELHGTVWHVRGTAPGQSGTCRRRQSA